MSDRPVKVVDIEADPPRLVAEFATVSEAVDFIGGIRDKTKVVRGGYAIDAPEEIIKEQVKR